MTISKNPDDRVVRAELAISRALFNCTQVTDLVSVAASCLGNPVLIQDFTTRLLAHAPEWQPETGDEILNSVFTQGYVTADLFEKYDYANVLARIQSTPHTFLLTSEKKTNRLICQLVVNQKYFGWFLTVACNHPFDHGDIEIMDFLAGALTVFLEKENILPAASHAEMLLRELLSGEPYTEESFHLRAKGFGWTLHGHYTLFVLEEAPSNEKERTVMAYKNHLSLLFPDVKMIEQNQKLVLLFDRQKTDSAERSIRELARKYSLFAAVSSPFSRITAVREVCHLLHTVLLACGELHLAPDLFRFRDYQFYAAVEELGSTQNLRFFCMPELMRVIRYDRAYGTDFAASYRIALECKSTQTAAKLLGIHRNTLEYRLKKFAEISGLHELSRREEENLLLSCRILELHPELVGEDAE